MVVLAIGTNRTAGRNFMSRMCVIYAVHFFRANILSATTTTAKRLLSIYSLILWFLNGFRLVLNFFATDGWMHRVNWSPFNSYVRMINSNDSWIFYFSIRINLTILVQVSVQCSLKYKTSFSHLSYSPYQFWK